MVCWSPLSNNNLFFNFPPNHDWLFQLHSTTLMKWSPIPSFYPSYRSLFSHKSRPHESKFKMKLVVRYALYIVLCVVWCCRCVTVVVCNWVLCVACKRSALILSKTNPSRSRSYEGKHICLRCTFAVVLCVLFVVPPCMLCVLCVACFVCVRLKDAFIVPNKLRPHGVISCVVHVCCLIIVFVTCAL